jgi:WD40 repeat protein
MIYRIIFNTLVFALFFNNNLIASDNPKFEIIDKQIIDFKFSPNGDKLAIAKKSSIEIWEIDTKSIILKLDNEDFQNIQAFDISFNNFSIVVGTKTGKIILCNFNSKDIIWKINTDYSITNLKIAPDNETIVAGNLKGNILKINSGNGAIINKYENHKKEITSLIFKKDANYLFSSSADKSIIIWDFKNDKMINQLLLHNDWVRDIAISPDETKIITCGDDNNLYYWNISNPLNCKLIDKSRAGFSWLTSINYNEDGNSVLYSNINGMVKFVTKYDTYLKRFRSSIIKVAFVPNKASNHEFAILIKGVGLKVYELDSFKIKN